MVSAVTSSTQGPNGESNMGCDSSPMENTGMVSSNYGDVNGSPNSPSRNGQHSNSISELRMPSSNGHSKVGRMEGLRRQFKERQKKLVSLSLHHGNTKQIQTTIPLGENGRNGVNHKIFIHLHQIFPEF